MSGALVLAHEWRLENSGSVPDAVRDFVETAVESIPGAMTRRLRPCRIVLQETLRGGRALSRWTDSGDSILIEIATGELDPHDIALELLRCTGQVLWQQLELAEEAAWLGMLHGEIEAGVKGEIDEDALRDKRRLLSSRASASSTKRLQDYARSSFASTSAEYVHCLWHDVTVRTGEEHLPAPWLKKRLLLMARWFPPGADHQLFPD